MRSLRNTYLCLLLLPVGLSAHNFRLDRVENGYRLYYGHDGMADHNGPEGLQIEKFRSGECVNASGKQTLLPIPTGDGIFFMGPRCDVILIRYRSGHFTKTTTGTVELPKRRTRNALHSWISFEYIKRIDLDTTPETGWNRPSGEGLEITPFFSGAPTRGGWVTLLVTENGKPLSSVPVAVEDDVRGATDSQGTIRLRLGSRPAQLFQATVRRPLSNASPDADEEIHTATLQFDIKG